MLNEVQKRIMPDVSLQSTLDNWSTISWELAESPRTRTSQGDEIESQAQTS